MHDDRLKIAVVDAQFSLIVLTSSKVLGFIFVKELILCCIKISLEALNFTCYIVLFDFN